MKQLQPGLGVTLFGLTACEQHHGVGHGLQTHGCSVVVGCLAVVDEADVIYIGRVLEAVFYVPEVLEPFAEVGVIQIEEPRGDACGHGVI